MNLFLSFDFYKCANQDSRLNSNHYTKIKLKQGHPFSVFVMPLILEHCKNWQKNKSTLSLHQYLENNLNKNNSTTVKSNNESPVVDKVIFEFTYQGIKIMPEVNFCFIIDGMSKQINSFSDDCRKKHSDGITLQEKLQKLWDTIKIKGISLENYESTILEIFESIKQYYALIVAIVMSLSGDFNKSLDLQTTYVCAGIKKNIEPKSHILINKFSENQNFIESKIYNKKQQNKFNLYKDPNETTLVEKSLFILHAFSLCQITEKAVKQGQEPSSVLFSRGVGLSVVAGTCGVGYSALEDQNINIDQNGSSENIQTQSEITF